MIAHRRGLLPAALLSLGLGPAVSAQTVLHDFPGSGSDFGYSVGNAGDVDADGTPDVIVGAPGAAAKVYSGRTGALLGDITPAASDTRFGSGVDGVGDLNGDGHSDMIVGEPTFDAGGFNRGRARVYSGKDGSVLHTFLGTADVDWLGVSVSGTGGLDGDQVPDILVGAYQLSTGPGYVRIYSGATGALVDTLAGVSLGDNYGFTVRGGDQDVDGDGVADFYVGAPSFESQGAGYVYSGATRAQLHRIKGTSGQGWFGSAGDLIEDVDGDNQADILIAGPFDFDSNANATGRVALYSGKTGALIDEWFGREDGGFYGHSVASIGDVNGDGLPEVGIGARNASHRGGGNAGALEVRSSDGRILYTHHEEGDGGQLGSAISWLGDVDGDGLDDFVAAAARRFDAVNNGWAGVLTGSSLVFDLAPDLCLEGDPVELTLRGVPQKLYFVFLHAIDGVPCTLKLNRGILGNDGVVQLSAPMPPGSAGLDLSLSCFSIPVGGGVVESNFEVLRVR